MPRVGLPYAKVRDVESPVVIVNPRSKGGLKEKEWARFYGAIADGLGPFQARFTEAPGHARQIALEEAKKGAACVVAFGGDGTISEVADGLIFARTHTRLGIIPRGTGGDFRRGLNLPSDARKAAERIRDAKTKSIDVGRVTYRSDSGNQAVRHFVNLASFGFSSVVAHRANTSSKRMGAKVAFLGAVLSSLAQYENVEVFIAVDGGEPRRCKLLLGAIGNSRFFGGGMKICPDACLDDGQLDLVTVGDLGRMEVMAKFHRIYAGTHLSMDHVDATRCHTVDVAPVHPDAKIPFEIDGETPGHLPARFEILQSALRLVV